MKAVREDKLFRLYTADSLYYISGQMGVQLGRKYSEILYPAKEDKRSPEEIARERLAKMGIAPR